MDKTPPRNFDKNKEADGFTSSVNITNKQQVGIFCTQTHQSLHAGSALWANPEWTAQVSWVC